MHIRIISTVAIAAVVTLPLWGCGGSSGSLASETSVLPPLPPSTDTSIALLVSHTKKLHLSEEQANSFSQLESDLAIQNEALGLQLQEEQRSHPKPPNSSQKKRGRGNGGRGGQMGGPGGGGSGARGGGGRGGGGRGKTSNPGGGKAAAKHDEAIREQHERIQHIRAQMMENNSRTIQAAYELLTINQRRDATKILEREGHAAPSSVENTEGQRGPTDHDFSDIN